MPGKPVTWRAYSIHDFCGQLRAWHEQIASDSGTQTVDELRQRLPTPAQVHIGPQATLVMDVGHVQLQVRLRGNWRSARSMLSLSSYICPAFADDLRLLWPVSDKIDHTVFPIWL